MARIHDVTPVFQARAHAFRGHEDVLLVATREDGGALIALANAYDHGFSTCFPEGSRWFLARLRRACVEGVPPEAAVEVALSAFFDAFPADPDDELIDPSLSFLIVWVDAGRLRAAALGGEVLRLWRAGEAIFEFPPKARRVRSFGPGWVCLARTAERTRTEQVALATFEPKEGDEIDVLNFRLDEDLRGGRALSSDSDPRLVAAFEGRPFVASVRAVWGGQVVDSDAAE